MRDSTLETGPYVIDSDGEGKLKPFNVTCNMTDKDGVGVTVISHDSENRTLVDGCEDPGCYSRDIHYKGATFSQLASLTTVSLFCEQFIKYECQGSLFHDWQNQTRNWWVSRDSIDMAYWGGAAPDSGKCACGMKGKCAKRGAAAALCYQLLSQRIQFHEMSFTMNKGVKFMKTLWCCFGGRAYKGNLALSTELIT